MLVASSCSLRRVVTARNEPHEVTRAQLKRNGLEANRCSKLVHAERYVLLPTKADKSLCLNLGWVHSVIQPRTEVAVQFERGVIWLDGECEPHRIAINGVPRSHMRSMASGTTGSQCITTGNKHALKDWVVSRFYQ